MLKLKVILNCLFIIGLVTGSYLVYDYQKREQAEKNSIREKTREAENYLYELSKRKLEADSLITTPVIPTPVAAEQNLIVENIAQNQIYRSFNNKLKDGEIMGIVSIPKFNVKNAIVQGVELKDLSSGIGHYRNTGMPGERRQIFLAGHNNRDFSVLSKLKIGEIIEIETTSGIFRYSMSGSKYVDQTDTSVIDPSQREIDELVLMTCFPFDSPGNAPQRFLIYATPIN
jgi:LPXTG-site transpeptidase (sortase) family protein